MTFLEVPRGQVVCGLGSGVIVTDLWWAFTGFFSLLLGRESRDEKVHKKLEREGKPRVKREKDRDRQTDRQTYRQADRERRTDRDNQPANPTGKGVKRQTNSERAHRP